MNKNFEINFEIPLFLLLFVVIGVLSAIAFTKIMSSNLKKNYDDVFESCQKTGHFYYEDKIIECKIKQ